MPNYYVDGDNGNDGNSGLSEALAKATVAAAVSTAAGTLDSASAPEIIYIQNNGSTVYAEAIAYTSKRFRFVGYGTTIDDGVRAVFDGGGTLAIGIESTPNANFGMLQIDNCKFQNYTGDGVSVIGSNANTGTWLNNCLFIGNGGHGLDSKTVSYGVTLSRCAFVSNGLSGANAEASYTYVNDCIFYNNTNDGLRLTNRPAYISNSVFAKNGAYGIRCAGFGPYFITRNTFDSNSTANLYLPVAAATPVVVSHNIFTRSGGYGILGVSGSQATLIDNGFGTSAWANTSGTTHLITSLLNEGGVSGDPQFAAPYDASTNTNPNNWDYRVGNATWQQRSTTIGPISGQTAWGSMQTIGGQYAEITSSGGGLLTHPGMSGGMRG